VIPRLEKRVGEEVARELMERAVAARRAGDDALADRLTRERMALLRGALRKWGSRGDDGDEGSNG